MTPEGEIKRGICEYLELRRDVRFWVQESQGTYDVKRGVYRTKGKYNRKGPPDIHVLLEWKGLPSIYVGLEVKDTKGKQSDSQKEFESYIREVNAFYFIVRSVEDAVTALYTARAEVSRILEQITAPR